MHDALQGVPSDHRQFLQRRKSWYAKTSGDVPMPPNGNAHGWDLEESLDVQWAHAMAPGANIILVAAKSNSDQDLIDALNYALDHHLGRVALQQNPSKLHVRPRKFV